MKEIEKCSYCGKSLIRGKGGNTRGCLICNKSICVDCSKHGICKIHLDPSNPEQEIAFKKNYQKQKLIKNK
jgi:hypothetical protein